MDVEMDPFADLFSEPVVGNARAGGKFQPKARPRVKKKVPVSVSSKLSKENAVTINSINVDPSKSVSPSAVPAENLSLISVDISSEIPCNSTLNDSSSHLETQNPINDTAALPLEYSTEGDQSSEAVAVSSKLITTEGDVGSRNPSFLGDTETSNIHGDKQAAFGSPGGEVENMDFEMDPFADLFSEPVVGNARAGGKFQPKAKPLGKKHVPVLVSSKLTNENAVTIDSKNVDPSKSVSPSAAPAEIGSTNLSLSSVDISSEIPCSSMLNDSSSHLWTQNPVNDTAALHPEFSTEGDRNSEAVAVSSQFITIEGDVGSRNPPFSGDTETSNIYGDKQAAFGKPGGETADIFSGLESLDDILSPSTTSNVRNVRKFQPKIKLNGQPRNKLPISRPVTNDADCSISCPKAPSLNASMDLEKGPSIAVLPFADSPFRASAPVDSNPDFHVSKEHLSNRETATSGNQEDLLKDDGRLEREEEAFHGLESVDIISHATTTSGDARFVSPEYLEEDLTPAYPSDGFIDFSTMGFSDSVPRDEPSERNLADVSSTETALPEEFVDSQAVHVSSGKKDARQVFTGSEGNGTSKSSRQLRKRSTAPAAVHEVATEAQEDQGLRSEPSTYSLVDEGDNNGDGNEIREEEPSNHKRARKVSKNTVAGNEKPVRRRKKASEGSDCLDKEPPKKKFSHSTRRNRRQVNKVLLETPDEEIDPRKLIIKDLILLAEAKERLLTKDANVTRTSFPNQSNSFAQDSSYNEEALLGSTQGQYPDDEQAAPTAQSYKLNYHSFMDRTPKERWSKQDTELFYEGIQQFGTDFAMIQQLFPGRTRHQVKLKYKKEERQQPMRLSDALSNRSKNHSHFELVIERLQKASAEAEQNSNRDDESMGLTGEEEEVTAETNEEVTKPDEEGAKSESKKEEGEADMEADEVDTYQAYSPTSKSHDHESETEDVYARWSQYKCDYDVF